MLCYEYADNSIGINLWSFPTTLHTLDCGLWTDVGKVRSGWLEKSLENSIQVKKNLYLYFQYQISLLYTVLNVLLTNSNQDTFQ
jgi:hypothetical protein